MTGQGIYGRTTERVRLCQAGSVITSSRCLRIACAFVAAGTWRSTSIKPEATGRDGILAQRWRGLTGGMFALEVLAIRSSHQPQRKTLGRSRRSPIADARAGKLPSRTGIGVRTSTTDLNIGPLSVAARWKFLCLRDNAKLYGLPHRAGSRRPKKGRAPLKAEPRLQRLGTSRQSRTAADLSTDLPGICDLMFELLTSRRSKCRHLLGMCGESSQSRLPRLIGSSRD